MLADMSALALTELLGAPVRDSAGQACGRVREVAIAPQEDRVRISLLIVKTKAGDRLLPVQSVASINGGVRAVTTWSEWIPINGTEGLFLLERDLLDQQVIDVHGRKVVRVNDGTCIRNPSEIARFLRFLPSMSAPGARCGACLRESCRLAPCIFF